MGKREAFGSLRRQAWRLWCLRAGGVVALVSMLDPPTEPC